MFSYAEASIRGAAEPDGENTVPIESVNVTPTEVKAALDNKESSSSESEETLSDSIAEKSKSATSKGKAKAKKVKKSAKKALDKSIDEFETDPCVSTGVLVGVLAVVAATVGIVQKRKGVSVTVEQGAIVGVGIAAVSTAYYLFITRGTQSAN